MSVTRDRVLSAVRERRPDLPPDVLDDVLRQCQEHHLEFFGRPLFTETGPEHRSLDEAELNTVGHVLSRLRQTNGQAPRELGSDELATVLAGAAERWVEGGHPDDTDSLGARLEQARAESVG
jgi:hypothetical protein